VRRSAECDISGKLSRGFIQAAWCGILPRKASISFERHAVVLVRHHARHAHFPTGLASELYRKIHRVRARVRDCARHGFSGKEDTREGHSFASTPGGPISKAERWILSKSPFDPRQSSRRFWADYHRQITADARAPGNVISRAAAGLPNPVCLTSSHDGLIRWERATIRSRWSDTVNATAMKRDCVKASETCRGTSPPRAFPIGPPMHAT